LRIQDLGRLKRDFLVSVASSRLLGRAHFSLFLLFIVAIFNYTDRYVIAVLLPDIKKDFALSDTQMGFLTGVAFTFLYVLAGVPIARIADKYSRKTLLSIALGIWSLTTALGGLAHNFFQIAVMRTLVGLGEAGASPPSYSLISDLYPATQRATAMSIYLAGSPTGVLIGFVLGGWLTQEYGWRAALVGVGLPGLLYAFALHRLLKEPPRGQTDATAPSLAPAAARIGLMGLLRKPTFWHTALATAYYNALIVGYVNWLPSFFVRSHGLGIKRTGLLLALVIGPSSLIGVVAGGTLADLLGRRDQRWYSLFPAAVILIATPLFMLSLLIDGLDLALLCLFIPLLIGAMQTSPPFATINGLVDARTRSVASAVLILIINVVSGGLGPITVGYMSDVLVPSVAAESLRYALVIATPVFGVLASLHYYLAAKHIYRDLGKIEA
jgi:predicted MFS family arabinose efflux permease